MINRILANIIALFFISIPVIVFSEEITIVPCGGPDDCNLSKLVDLGNDFQSWLIGIVATLAAIGFAYVGARALMFPGSVDVKKETISNIKRIGIGLAIFLLAFTVIEAIVKELVNEDTNALRFLK
jgi:hypothetical protein